MELNIQNDKRTITVLNTLVKAAKAGHRDAVGHFTTELANFAKERSTEVHQWSLSPNKKWKDGAIFLIAHWDDPMRALVVMYKRPVEHPINACTYEFRKLHYTPGKTKITIDAQSKQHQRFYAKKGFWLVLDESVDWNLFWPPSGVDSVSTPELFTRLRDVYMRWVNGMQKAPTADYMSLFYNKPGLKRHPGVEQFMLDYYPTEEWFGLFPIDLLAIHNPKKREKKLVRYDDLARSAARASAEDPQSEVDKPVPLNPDVEYKSPVPIPSFPVETIYAKDTTPKRKVRKSRGAPDVSYSQQVPLFPSPPQIDWKKYEESDVYI